MVDTKERSEVTGFRKLIRVNAVNIDRLQIKFGVGVV